MASFEQRGNAVRAIVSFRDGKKTQTFDTRGGVLLNEVNPHDIELWIARRTQDVKTSTARRELALISSAFAYRITVRKWARLRSRLDAKHESSGAAWLHSRLICNFRHF